MTSKRCYNIVAGVLNNYSKHQPEITAIIAVDLADKFEEDNPRFNRAKFFIACDVYGHRMKNSLLTNT